MSSIYTVCTVIVKWSDWKLRNNNWLVQHGGSCQTCYTSDDFLRNGATYPCIYEILIKFIYSEKATNFEKSPPIICPIYCQSNDWHHIATHSLSSPITSETVSKKFPGNFQKFPKKLEALLLVAQLGTGNFYRF